MNILIAVSAITSFTALLILTVIMLLYFSLQKKYVELIKHEERLSKSKRLSRKSRIKADKIIEEARVAAQRIVQDATLKSQQTIGQSEHFIQEQKNLLENQIKTYTQIQLQDYQKLLTDIKNETKATLDIVSKRMDESASTQITEFQQNLKDIILNSDNIIKNAITSSVGQIEAIVGKYQSESLELYSRQKSKLDNDLQVYRDQQVKKIDDKIFAVIEKVMKDFIGKSLDSTEHEEEVIRSLEKAKNDITF